MKGLRFFLVSFLVAYCSAWPLSFASSISLPKMPSLSFTYNISSISWLPSMPSLPSIPSLPSMPSLRSLTSSLPSMPSLTSLPSLSSLTSSLPSMPSLRSLTSSLPSMPSLTSLPSLSSLTSSLPSMPSLPSIPAIPQISDFDFEEVKKRAQQFYKTLPQFILDDADALVPELIQKHGYPCETHKVITPDGYIVTLHRIPHGRNGTSTNRPVAYVQHGLLASSADWLISGPGKALGYLLADSGFDVWLPNARGNRYSRNHVNLDPDSPEFWDFSWHEIALYDVTTTIDYVLQQTRQEKLYYIGHSQGTTLFYVMCSERPEYNQKIKAMFSFAPIAYMNHLSGPVLQILSRGEPTLGALSKSIGMHEFLPNTRRLAKMTNFLCNDYSITQVLCTNVLFVMFGFNKKQMNTTLLPIIMGHTPAGASMKQIRHYGQEIISAKFRQFDYGQAENQKRYNNSEPPRYHLYKVTVPVYLYYSRNDWMSGESDVIRLYHELGNPQAKFLVADESFNHVDYQFAIQARELLYDGVIELMNSIETSALSKETLKTLQKKNTKW